MKTKSKHSNSDCPCCSGTKFEVCCKPLLEGSSQATTPESLMRSRYTAFVLHNHDYLRHTWLPSFRPLSIQKESRTVWLNLKIIEATPHPTDQSRAQVTFIATFIQNNILHKMTEKSNFLKKNGVWFYCDGINDTQQSTLNLNTKCPCDSGKKYKRCCHEKI